MAPPREAVLPGGGRRGEVGGEGEEEEEGVGRRDVGRRALGVSRCRPTVGGVASAPLWSTPSGARGVVSGNRKHK